MKSSFKFPWACISLLTAFALVGWLGALAGQAAAEDAVPKFTESAQAVSDLGMAHELIEYGRRTKTPEALITAALILHRTPAEKAADAQLDESNAPAALLAEARKLRPTDKTLAGLADQAAEAISETARGAITGPRTTGGVLRRGSGATITVGCKAGEATVFRVYGSPASSPPSTPYLRVILKNAAGQIVGQQTAPSVTLGYVPPVTSPVTVSIVNVATCSVQFTLIHN
jgi:hypothetical protein